MSRLPKIKIKYDWGEDAEVCDFEQTRDRFAYGVNVMVVVEGQVLYSYDQLVWLAAQEDYKDREFLEVKLLPGLGGGQSQSPEYHQRRIIEESEGGE